MARVSAVAVARRLRRIHAQSRANGMSSPPIPNTANRVKPVMLSTSHAKFCPKKPVMKVNGRNTVARIVSRSIVLFGAR